MRDAGEHLRAFSLRRAARIFEKDWDRVYDGYDTWDYQWVYSTIMRGRYSIVPNVNLVSNIGFGKDATITKDATHWAASLPVKAMTFPLIHPRSVTRDIVFERKYFKEVVVAHQPIVRALWKALSNRYFYGALIRRIPIIGQLWQEWRRSVIGVTSTEHSRDGR